MMKNSPKGKTNEKKNTGSCNDKNCPVHGHLSLRGRVFMGTVADAKMQKTVTVEWIRQKFIPKYERFLNKKTKVKAHNPPCIDAKQGEIVKIMETRPLSKTKNFVIIEKIGQDEDFMIKEIEREQEEQLKEQKTKDKEEKKEEKSE